MLKKQPGMKQKAQAGAQAEFSDTSNEAVVSCARLGITGGVGEGTAFNPAGTFSREQAIAAVVRISSNYGK